MKKEKTPTAGQIILGSILLLGICLVVSSLVSNKEEKEEKNNKDYSSMSVRALQKELRRLIAKDTAEAYMEAGKIRDMIKTKNAAAKKQYT